MRPGVGGVFRRAGVGLDVHSRRTRRAAGLAVATTEIAFLEVFVAAQAVLLAVLVCNRYRGVPLVFLILCVVAAAVQVLATQTPFGRALFAIGGNEEAARMAGIPVGRTVTAAYALMGLVVALTGFLQTSYAGAATVTVGELMELDAIAACVIGGTSLKGGRGSVLGTLLGAAVMATLLNGMTLLAITPEWKLIARGTVLVAAVLFDVQNGAGVDGVASPNSRVNPRHRAHDRCLELPQFQRHDDQLEDLGPDRLQPRQILDDDHVGAEQQVVHGVRLIVDRRCIDSHEVNPVFDEPGGRCLAQHRVVGEIVVLAPVARPPGPKDDLAGPRDCVLVENQVGQHDLAARTEIAHVDQRGGTHAVFQRHLIDGRHAVEEMSRSVHVRTGVIAGGERRRVAIPRFSRHSALAGSPFGGDRREDVHGGRRIPRPRGRGGLQRMREIDQSLGHQSASCGFGFGMSGIRRLAPHIVHRAPPTAYSLLPAEDACDRKADSTSSRLRSPSMPGTGGG